MFRHDRYAEQPAAQFHHARDHDGAAFIFSVVLEVSVVGVVGTSGSTPNTSTNHARRAKSIERRAAAKNTAGAC